MNKYIGTLATCKAGKWVCQMIVVGYDCSWVSCNSVMVGSSDLIRSLLVVGRSDDDMASCSVFHDFAMHRFSLPAQPSLLYAFHPASRGWN